MWAKRSQRAIRPHLRYSYMCRITNPRKRYIVRHVCILTQPWLWTLPPCYSLYKIKKAPSFLTERFANLTATHSSSPPTLLTTEWVTSSATTTPQTWHRSNSQPLFFTFLTSSIKRSYATCPRKNAQTHGALPHYRITHVYHIWSTFQNIILPLHHFEKYFQATKKQRIVSFVFLFVIIFTV